MAIKNIKVKVNVENNFVVDKTEEKKLCKILVAKGDKGQDGNVSFDELTEEQKAQLKGEDGKGIPEGGTAGQILAKTSDNDFDAEWIDNNAEIDLTEYAKKEELPTKVSELENDSGYVINTDYASSDNVGLVKTESYYGLHTSSRNGTLYCEQFSYDEYTNEKDGNCFIGKGTLENVLEAKDYASKGYVDEKVANIDIGGGVDLSGYATKEDLDNKTNTSVLPNDNGDIKTRFRICNKAENNSPIIYFPLVKLPKDNSKNSASVILKGRVGGFLSKDMAMINALIWNRTTTGISLFNINADTYTLEEPLRLCDIVVYTNDDTTDTVYLKCREWYVFDIDLEVYQSTAEILYDGTYLTEEPSGTLSASASTSDKRVEVYDGKLYVNGTEINGDIDLSNYADKEYVDEKIASIPSVEKFEFPVGYIYMSVEETSPAELFGGIWEQIKDTFLLACGDIYNNGDVGGEAEHTLTINEMPSHSHSYTFDQVAYNKSAGTSGFATNTGGYVNESIIGVKGGGQAHNNMPPYLSVYMWKKVANI